MHNADGWDTLNVDRIVSVVTMCIDDAMPLYHSQSTSTRKMVACNKTKRRDGASGPVYQGVKRTCKCTASVPGCQGDLLNANNDLYRDLKA